MATTKPRITITLEPRSYQTLKVISECSGKPMSAFVSEMLESAEPTLNRMAFTFKKIKEAQDSERAAFIETIDDAQATIEPAVMAAIGQFDLFIGKIDKAVAAKQGDGRRTAAVSRLPSASPPTNRGVTPPPSKPSKPSTVAAFKPVGKKKFLKK